jgi:hypothetical protein
VKKVSEQKPEIPYIFAVDRTANPQEQAIIEGISKGIGSGEIEYNDAPKKKLPMFIQKKVHYNEVKTIQAEWTFTLQANIKVKPSSLVVKQDEEGKEEDVEFEWHCKDGISGNIGKVAQEYCEVNNLKPIKIYINGPPLSGKTSLAKEYFKVLSMP